MPEPLVTSPWARARWLVLAPHPDDETLGAGALIAHTAALSRLGAIVFLTDGTGSHPDGTPRLAMTRQKEARRALGRIVADSPPIVWMGWRDACPHEIDSPAFARDAARLGALLRYRRIDAIAVTDHSEDHCDHRMAYHLAQAAARKAHRAVTLFAYHVWSAPPGGVRRVATPPMSTGRRRDALRAHRSQMSSVIGDGFRIPREKLRMPAVDVLTLRKLGR
jgi:LmbE family N-acetylglucosaminyl deacetylase